MRLTKFEQGKCCCNILDDDTDGDCTVDVKDGCGRMILPRQNLENAIAVFTKWIRIEMARRTAMTIAPTIGKRLSTANVVAECQYGYR